MNRSSRTPGTYLGQSPSVAGSAGVVSPNRVGPRPIDLRATMDQMTEDAVAEFNRPKPLDLSAGQQASSPDLQAQQERLVGLQQNVWSTTDQLAADNPDIAPDIRAAGAAVAMPHGIASKQASDAQDEEQRRLLAISTDPGGYEKYRRYKAGELKGYEILGDPSVSPHWKRMVSEEAMNNPNAGRRPSQEPRYNHRDQASFRDLSKEMKKALRQLPNYRELLRNIKAAPKHDPNEHRVGPSKFEAAINAVVDALKAQGYEVSPEDLRAMQGVHDPRNPADMRRNETDRRNAASQGILARGATAAQLGSQADLRKAENEMIIDLRRRGALPRGGTPAAREAEERARQEFRSYVSSSPSDGPQQPPSSPGVAPQRPSARQPSGSVQAGSAQPGSWSSGSAQAGSGGVASFASVAEAAKSPNLSPGQAVSIGGSQYIAIPSQTGSGAPQYGFVPAVSIGQMAIPDPGSFGSADEWGATLSDEQRQEMLRTINSDPRIRSMMSPEMRRDIDQIVRSRVGAVGQRYASRGDEQTARATLRERENRSLHALMTAVGGGRPQSPGGGRLDPEAVASEQAARAAEETRREKALTREMEMPPLYQGQAGPAEEDWSSGSGGQSEGMRRTNADPGVLRVWQSMSSDQRRMVSEMQTALDIMAMPEGKGSADDRRLSRESLIRVLSMAYRGASAEGIAAEIEKSHPGFTREFIGVDSTATAGFTERRQQAMAAMRQASDAVRGGQADMSSMVPHLQAWYDTIVAGMAINPSLIPQEERQWFSSLPPEAQTSRDKFVELAMQSVQRTTGAQQQPPQAAAAPDAPAPAPASASPQRTPEQQWDDRVRAMSEADLEKYIDETAARTKLTDPAAKQAFAQFMRDHWGFLQQGGKDLDGYPSLSGYPSPDAMETINSFGDDAYSPSTSRFDPDRSPAEYGEEAYSPNTGRFDPDVAARERQLSMVDGMVERSEQRGAAVQAEKDRLSRGSGTMSSGSRFSPGSVSGRMGGVESEEQFERALDDGSSEQVPYLQRPEVRRWLDSSISRAEGEPVSGLSPEQERRYAESLLIGSKLISMGVDLEGRNPGRKALEEGLPRLNELEPYQIVALTKKYSPLLRPNGDADRRFSEARMADRRRRDPAFASKVDQIMREREAMTVDPRGGPPAPPKRGRGVDFA